MRIVFSFPARPSLLVYPLGQPSGHRLKRSALKDLQAAPKSDQKRLLDLIENNLSKDPYEGEALSGEFKDYTAGAAGNSGSFTRSNKELLVVLVLRIGRHRD